MVSTIRQAYNQAFNAKSYSAFLKDINQTFNYDIPFRIAESPVFIDAALKKQLFEACEGIMDQICQPDFKEKTQAAILPKYHVDGEDDHTLFLQMDFGICKDANGVLSPQLIEIQGFPSLYFFQDLLANAYKKHFPIPDNYSHLFDGLDSETYVNLLRKNIVGSSQPENVVLLEVEPERQNTRIDFLCTQKELGIAVKCISDLKKEGRKVYYLDDNGKKVGVEKIFNRVIFDELVRYPDLKREFYFSEPADIEWIGHPHWFFRISKYTLPFLKSPYVPDTRFLSEIDNIPTDLENYVLKPLYSFAGTGVIINLNQYDLEAIKDPENYILQRKVEYAPVIETPNDPAKCEIRMLMIWEKDAARPRIINNLARLSKGAMIGVRYNKNKDWVGASTGFFEK
jgi:hypothetical protein